MILSENISALIQNSFCRCLKHVSSVADMQGNVAEKYVYDPAGNILRKTIAGKTTSYTYDKANQLVSSVCDGKTTHYEYDAAGRLIKEGDKSYSYGWLDKVLAVRENDKKIASFDYQVDGQIAQAIHGDQSEEFFWDGLALIHRGETSFINEPYVTGGNPILSSKQGVMFTDMLGSTLNIGGKAIHMTAFGETKDTDALFTGKPYIGELGYAFLFRNYRADQGKWQTSDPLGYPDGWNNLAYCKNDFINSYDFLGLEWEWVSTKSKTDYYIWGPNESGPYLSRTAAQSVVDSKISTLKVNIINGLKSNLSPKEILVMDNWTISFNISETPAGEFYITGHLSISFTYSIWRKKEE